MDFSNLINKNEIKLWFAALDLLRKTSIEYKNYFNAENVEVFEISFESLSNIGLLLIYADNHLFFNFLDKNDDNMQNHNWSITYNDYNDLKTKIEEAILLHWKV